MEYTNIRVSTVFRKYISEMRKGSETVEETLIRLIGVNLNIKKPPMGRPKIKQE